MKKLLLIIAILLTGFSNSYASHLMGADIVYTHVGGNDYEITLTVYGDCSGISVGTSQFVNFTSTSCGQNISFNIPFIQIIEVSQVCPTATTTCNGGTQPGTEQNIYRGTVTLPPCPDWIMSWTSGARNPAITNLVNPGSQNLYIENTLNNVIGTNNNSPQFSNLPTPYLCANNLTIYSHAATDIDGDSLYYTLSTPLSAAASPIAFAGGYTVADPIITTAGMNLDQTTGEMCFTPSQTQICVVSVLIQEYRNGVLIGSQIREMQVVIANCTNQNPTNGVGATCGGAAVLTITSAGPTVAQTDPNSIIMCPNDFVCFDVPFSDPDGDNITITSNIALAIPGAILTITNNGTPNPVANICWNPTPLDSGLNVFAIIAVDDACPISGTQAFTFDITIFDQPYAGSDDTICGNQTSQLTATGGAGYTWTSIAGDPIIVGTNFSCNPCYNPIASPTQTTTYVVTSSLSAACINTDTVTIFVAPDITPTAYGDTLLCDFLPHTIGVNVNPAGAYTYLWSPALTLNNPNIASPTATATQTTTYSVLVTSALGCAKSDSAVITVMPPPVLSLVPGDSTICQGASLQFGVESTCDYTLEMFDSWGDGWNGQSISVYENGILIGTYGVSNVQGTANTVVFPVINGSTITLVYNTGSFQNESSFNLIDGTGATQFSVAAGGMTGWIQGNTYFTGIANCGPTLAGYTFSWSPTTGLSNPNISDPIATPLVTTAYTVTLTAGACSVDRTQTITVVPDYTYTVTQSDTNVCLGAQVSFNITPNPAGAYNYSWQPAGIMNNPAIANPIATINTPGQTMITVSIDNGGGCTKLDTFYVNSSIGSQPVVTATTTDTLLICGGSATLGASVVGATLSCQETATINGQDASPATVATVSSLSCVPAGATVTAITLDATIGGVCPSWYTYNIIINGTTQFLQQCDQTGLDLSPFLPITSVAIDANDEDAFSDNVTLNLTLNITYSATPYSYLWTPALTLNNPNIANPIATPTTTTDYIVTVTDTVGGCFDTDTVRVVAYCLACYHPAITITNPTCNNGTDGNIIIDPTFVTNSEVQSFTWTDSISGTVLQTTMNLTTGMSDTLMNLGAGAYTITMVDSSGCTNDTTIYLTEPTPVVIPIITNNDTICIGGSTIIDATAIGGNGGPYNYTWTNLNTGATIPGNGPHSISPTDTLTCYSVSATDPLGCISAANQVCISLFDSIIATTVIASPVMDSINICPTLTANLGMSATGGNGGPYTYEWWESGSLISSSQFQTVTPTSASTIYTGYAYDNCNSPRGTVTIYVNWVGLVLPSFTKNKPDSCYPMNGVIFTNTSAPVSLVATSSWTVSNGNSGTGNTFSANFGTPVCQDVTLSIVTVDGCLVDTTYADFVCPFDYPVANFYSTPPITDLLNTEIDFTNLSTGNNLTYLWTFNSGLNPDSSSATNPTFIFSNTIPGVYEIELAATSNPEGCVRTFVGTVVINGIYLFFVPNSFTPNGDGVNDLFFPEGEGIDFTNYTMQIFNRWGEVLFESSDASKGWDGTYKGKSLKADTYIWKIVAKEKFSTIIHDNYGNINLMK